MSERVVRRDKTTRVQIEGGQETSMIMGQESDPDRSLGSRAYQGCSVEAGANGMFTSEAKSTCWRMVLDARSFGGHPDTAESGETYDIEASFILKSIPLVAIIVEYSE